MNGWDWTKRKTRTTPSAHWEAGPQTKPPRIPMLDWVRGGCVVLMVFYHAFFTLGELFGLRWAQRLYEGTTPLEPFFAGLFILLAGVSSRLSHSNWLRGGKLLAVSLGLTAVTVWVFPLFGVSGSEIYFGILHFLACWILLYALLERPLSAIPPVLGVCLCVILFLLTMHIPDGYLALPGGARLALPHGWYANPYLFPLGICTPQFFSADYFPLIPMGFVFLAGICLGMYVKQGRIPAFARQVRLPPLEWIGRHALLIYLLHQPVIFAAASFVEFLLRAVSQPI